MDTSQIKNKKIKVKMRGRAAKGAGEEREKLFSKIYGIQIVCFCRSKKQSRSTHRELRVGIKILEFHQISCGRRFFYLGYFYPKGHLMAWSFLRGRKFQSQNFGTECRNF